MAKKSASGRNSEIARLLEDLFTQAAEADAPDSPVGKDLDALFGFTERSFREILLVIALAKIHDAIYDPATDFYGCNPRSVYEQVIRPALTIRRIPRGQSGPLNIAKGAQGIDRTWAARRRPFAAAQAVLSLVEHLMPLPATDLRGFTIALLSRFLKAASAAASHDVVIDPESDPLALFDLCEALVRQAPDKGNTPQRVVGYLLEEGHAGEGSGVVVSGHADSASATSLTGKKPGDICERAGDGRLVRVYEVTVKPFGPQRMEEACDSLAAWSKDNSTPVPEVTVLCREEDAPGDILGPAEQGLLLGVAEMKGIRFVFADLFQWIAAEIVKLPPEGRKRFDRRLSGYIADPSTALDVKRLWRTLRDEKVGEGEDPLAADVPDAGR